MENKADQRSKSQELAEEYRSLNISSESVGVIDFGSNMTEQSLPTSPEDPEYNKALNSDVHSLDRQAETDHSCSFSIAMPSSPSGLHFHQVKSVTLPTIDEAKLNSPTTAMDDKCFDSFKTWPKPQEPDVEAAVGSHMNGSEHVPEVGRYLGALQGPELDIFLKPSEVLLVLPENKKWPFLLRFPISSFGMCLGVSSQAILWKNVVERASLSSLHASIVINLFLWSTALVLMVAVSTTYALKLIFYFEAVRREYYHPVRFNFFFAPWIVCLFLVLGMPPLVAINLSPVIWYILMAPIFCLELKIYGQWMAGGQRRLSQVGNPSTHLLIIGNFVGALLGANMGIKEGAIFFFAVGLAHYLVLFVTLYQRLPTNVALPKDLHPVYFLFIAPPSVACVAWAKIQGDFDHGAKFAYFFAMFLYVSLAVRMNFFRGVRFSLAWWAYTFPMTAAAIATIQYSMNVTNLFTKLLSVGLSAIAAFTVIAVLVLTVVHAFILDNLFPNDIAIAITEKRPPKSRKKPKPGKATKCSGLKGMETSVTESISCITIVK